MVIIHTCNSRLWYVSDFLIPSLQSQGITEIRLWLDRNNEGNLKSCMDCFEWCGGLKDKNSWHLQDDVLISSKFAETIKQVDYYTGVVNGFICKISGNSEFTGGVKYDKAWYSFPCIRIPNKIAFECAKWFYREAIVDPKYRKWVDAQKYDDAFFKDFMETRYPDIDYLNLKPNLVEHVDYLIGGSVINKIRESKSAMSCYWDEPERVRDLENRINQYKYRKEHKS